MLSQNADVVLSDLVTTSQKLVVAGKPISASHDALVRILERHGSKDLADHFCMPLEGGGTYWVARNVNSNSPAPNKLMPLTQCDPEALPKALEQLRSLISMVTDIRTSFAENNSADFKSALMGLDMLLRVPSKHSVLYNGKDLRISQWGEAPVINGIIEKLHLRDILAELTPPPPAPPPPQPTPIRRVLGNYITNALGLDAEARRRRAREGGEAGTITVTLMWDTHDDLDLAIQCPDGQIINYGNKSACGGTLDIDMNAGNTKSDEPVENIFFEKLPVAGLYRILLNNYASVQIGDPGTSYAVAITTSTDTNELRGRLRHRDGPKEIATFLVTEDGDPQVTTDFLGRRPIDA
ncbi:MAG: hypothetical protein AB8B94_14260 [Hyphomicrobiales bacterium]